MKVADLLSELGALGVSLRADGPRLLCIRKARETLTPGLEAAIASHKAEILQWLSWPVEGTFATSCDPATPLSAYDNVSTPRGVGRVVAVLPGYVSVRLRCEPRNLHQFLPCEVKLMNRW